MQMFQKKIWQHKVLLPLIADVEFHVVETLVDKGTKLNGLATIKNGHYSVAVWRYAKNISLTAAHEYGHIVLAKLAEKKPNIATHELFANSFAELIANKKTVLAAVEAGIAKTFKQLKGSGYYAMTVEEIEAAIQFVIKMLFKLFPEKETLQLAGKVDELVKAIKVTNVVSTSGFL